MMSLGLLGQYGSVESSSDISDSDEEQPTSVDGKGTTEYNSTAPGNGSLTEKETRSKSSECGSSSLVDPLQLSRVVGGNDDSTDPLSLVGDSESDSKTDTSSDEHSSEDVVEEPHLFLPLPDLDGATQTSSSNQQFSSVFSNPFQEAEKAKMAVLKQHVDFDKPKTKSSKITTRPIKQHPHHNKRISHRSEDREYKTPGDLLFDDSDSSAPRMEGKKRQRRGVGNALEPSKKVMKQHRAIQAKERPWTVQKY